MNSFFLNIFKDLFHLSFGIHLINMTVQKKNN